MIYVTKQSVGLNSHNPQYYWGIIKLLKNDNPLG